MFQFQASCRKCFSEPISEPKVQIFKVPNAEKHKFVEATEAVLLFLDGGGPRQNIEVMPYVSFAKTSPNIKLNSARLPPTREATQCHALCTTYKLDMAGKRKEHSLMGLGSGMSTSHLDEQTSS